MIEMTINSQTKTELAINDFIDSIPVLSPYTRVKKEAKRRLNILVSKLATLDSKLQKAIDLSGNEFSMGYDDSGCFWRFYYGNRGAGSMMDGWSNFQSESPEVGEALDEYINYIKTVRRGIIR